jgi:hypothetical protein
MLEFKKPLPVMVEDGNGNYEKGYAIYVSNSGTFENDVWCVALCRDGIVQHYLSKHIRIEQNNTFNIIKK